MLRNMNVFLNISLTFIISFKVFLFFIRDYLGNHSELQNIKKQRENYKEDRSRNFMNVSYVNKLFKKI